MNVLEEFNPKYNFNVKQTKNEYSKVNNLALRGFEVATYDHNTKEVVSHVKKAVFDYLLRSVNFTVEETFDEELKGWTVYIPELNLYGEGDTKESAVSDLINTIDEYIALYTEMDFLSKHESPEKQAAIMKLMRCKDDDAMRKVLGV